MKDPILKNKLVLLGGIVGSIGGYLYYYQVGCNSEGCLITSDPVNSALYGAVMGGLLFSLFRGRDAPRGEADDSDSGNRSHNDSA